MAIRTVVFTNTFDDHFTCAGIDTVLVIHFVICIFCQDSIIISDGHCHGRLNGRTTVSVSPLGNLYRCIRYTHPVTEGGRYLVVIISLLRFECVRCRATGVGCFIFSRDIDGGIEAWRILGTSLGISAVDSLDG